MVRNRCRLFAHGERVQGKEEGDRIGLRKEIENYQEYIYISTKLM